MMRNFKCASRKFLRIIIEGIVNGSATSITSKQEVAVIRMEKKYHARLVGWRCFLFFIHNALGVFIRGEFIFCVCF